MKTRLLAMLCAVMVLSGCASLLEREYSSVEPHSSKFWESEAADTLRAENYQDIVNDLLILIGRHKESATLRLYNYEDDLAVKETVEKAAIEVQQETPLGAYAVEFITSSSQQQRGYYEISIQIGYRRTTEQIQSVVNATSAEAVYSLLESALDAGGTELAVRISYWGSDSREKVETAVAQLRKDRVVTDASVWLVNTYPATGAVGLLEFILEPTEEDLAEAAETTKPEVGGSEETSGVPEEEK